MLYGKLRDRLVPTLRDAANGGDDPEQVGRRVRVILTGTDIAGVTRDTQDSFGGTLKITDHRLHARFAYGGDAGGDDTPGGWAGMLPPGADERTAMAEAVARAARTSASFPIAFESSELLLAGADDVTSNSALGDALATRDGHNVAAVMRDEHRPAPLRRWAMDGGVLDNSPIAAVLETMTGLSAERPVQRAVLFVVPYTDDPAQDPDPEPGLSRVLDTVLNMPRDMGFADHLEEVERDLARRAGDRTTYDRLLALPVGVLQPLAESVYRSFWRLRAVTSVWSLLQAYRGTLDSPLESGVALPGQQLASALETLAETAQVRWLPPVDAPATGLWDGLVGDASEWRFGGAPSERVALRIADWLMGAREVLPENASDLRDGLARHQALVHGAIRTYRASEQARRAEEGRSIAEARAASASGKLTRLDIVERSSATWTSERQAAARALLDAVAQALVDVQQLDLPERARSYVQIEGVDRSTSQEDVARRLLMADVAWRALRGELDDEHQASNRYEFLRLNAAAPPPFQPRTDAEHWKRENGDPQQKLFGLQLGHFAGFVRSSWRANDFLWGRLDGAARLVDLLIAPSRLQRSPLAYETMAAIPGLRLPLPARRGPFLNPLDPDELEDWRSCLQDTLALGILGAELENVVGRDGRGHERARLRSRVGPRRDAARRRPQRPFRRLRARACRGSTAHDQDARERRARLRRRRAAGRADARRRRVLPRGRRRSALARGQAARRPRPRRGRSRGDARRGTPHLARDPRAHTRPRLDDTLNGRHGDGQFPRARRRGRVELHLLPVERARDDRDGDDLALPQTAGADARVMARERPRHVRRR